MPADKDRIAAVEDKDPKELKIAQELRRFKLDRLIPKNSFEKGIYDQRNFVATIQEMVETVLVSLTSLPGDEEARKRELALIRNMWRECDKRNVYLKVAESVNFAEAEEVVGSRQQDELSEWNDKYSVSPSPACFFQLSFIFPFLPRRF